MGKSRGKIPKILKGVIDKVKIGLKKTVTISGPSMFSIIIWSPSFLTWDGGVQMLDKHFLVLMRKVSPQMNSIKFLYPKRSYLLGAFIGSFYLQTIKHTITRSCIFSCATCWPNLRPMQISWRFVHLIVI